MILGIKKAIMILAITDLDYCILLIIFILIEHDFKGQKVTIFFNLRIVANISSSA